DVARAIELRDVHAPEAERRDDGNLLELVGVIETLLSDVGLQNRLLHAITQSVDGPAESTSDGVLIVERPPIEKVDVIAAVHPRTGPHREPLVRALRVEIADTDALRRVSREMEEWRKERQRGDDTTGDAVRPLVFAPQLELRVAPLIVDSRAEGDD